MIILNLIKRLLFFLWVFIFNFLILPFRFCTGFRNGGNDFLAYNDFLFIFSLTFNKVEEIESLKLAHCVYLKALRELKEEEKNSPPMPKLWKDKKEALQKKRNLRALIVKTEKNISYYLKILRRLKTLGYV